MSDQPSIPNQRLQVPYTYFLMFVFLAALLLLPSLVRGGLSGYDDALYAYEGKEIAFHGNWGTIRFDGVPNFEYPPLFIWLEALSIKAVGVSDFAAKLPGGLLGLCTLIVVYFLARSISESPWVPLYSMTALISTQYFMNGSAHAMTDVPFTFFFTCAIFSYVKGLRQPRYLALCGLSVGLGLLTRSVIGFLPLFLIIVHGLLIRRDDLFWSRHALTALLISLSLPSIWFAYEFLHYGNDFVAAHFAFIANKLSSNATHRGSWHPTDVFFYGKFFLQYYWPWLPVLIAGLVFEAEATFRCRDQAAGLLVLWIAFVILAFTLPETKYGRYVMPAFPACAIVVGRTLDRWIPPRRRALFLQTLWILGLATVAGLVIFPAKPRATDMRALAPVADAHSLPGERVLIYTYGQTGWDYQNQFLWYGNRYSELLTNSEELLKRVASTPSIVIMDKPSFQRLAAEGLSVKLLGESDHFVCFQSSKANGGNTNRKNDG